MAAWKHFAFWNADSYNAYRKYVAGKAESFARDRRDCADLSMTFLIDFAESQGLCLTFTDLNGVRYISKGEGQQPSKLVGGKSWTNKSEYARAVLGRLSAKSLFLENAEPNPKGPEPGDLILKTDHAAMVYRVYPAGSSHPKATEYREPTSRIAVGIPRFPGNEKAKLQVDQFRYFRDRPPTYNVPRSVDEEVEKEKAVKVAHIDYLNHRGEGKEGAELILYTPVQEITDLGFGFYRYQAKVMDDWPDWNGIGSPPR